MPAHWLLKNLFAHFLANLQATLSWHFNSVLVILVLDILFFFQRNGIKSLINLQHPGEHSSCGFGLEPVSGFSYIPEHFMQEDSMCNSSISISDIIIDYLNKPVV